MIPAMQLPGFAELHDRTDRRREPATIAVAGGEELTVLQAVCIAKQRGWITPRIVGSKVAITSLAGAEGLELDDIELVDADAENIARLAVAEVRAGRAQALMKGQIATPALMQAILDPEHGLRTGRVICQVVLMEVPRDNRRFLMADTGICVRPSPADKEDILRSTVEVAHGLGLARPRVALMAATETVKPAMPETVDAQELTRLP